MEILKAIKRQTGTSLGVDENGDENSMSVGTAQKSGSTSALGRPIVRIKFERL